MLAQTHDNLELIISDNASTDGTRAICEAYAERDPRVRYVREAEGRGAAYNFGRPHARQHPRLGRAVPAATTFPESERNENIFTGHSRPINL